MSQVCRGLGTRAAGVLVLGGAGTKFKVKMAACHVKLSAGPEPGAIVRPSLSSSCPSIFSPA